MARGETYEEFTAKFEPKRTTDDCYTPPEVYDAVLSWVCGEYGVDPASVVRPFYPGGDFERAEYPEGCCVVDNPPFSILSRIRRFYVSNGIRFFLFAPTITLFSGAEFDEVTHIVCDACVTYENGAKVPTSFVTNMGGDVAAVSDPELTAAVNEANDRLVKAKKRKMPKYEYPDHVLTAARMRWLAKHGEHLEIKRSDCVRINGIDASKKPIFGGGLLLSDRAAAERAAAERFALSRREREIVACLG